ncbi:hypothetical protein SDRG_12493 [Saprolegnia diclina VS20]|uniref:Apple domain-containing protein n=1 Tax=Saprolegnia diclina (strain VS20) TaxID=1156394 RepID=T0Q529_SAPDV|nr:hypothetical protein SDRG_12493 [Saprolegnia diclina VS20]EQC29721.1 hypothetical protein SDRG_12493 [Saprolegnia diclina VS20]|eukprot:XP_008616787.1 hypothetical protein SDRG_12493 [Saprolegnia diclina VS20]
MQLLTTTALLAAMAMTTTYARTCGSPEWNTDFAGSDISNFGTTGDFGNMLKQCCDACTASNTCVAYTLADNVCYLKSGDFNSMLGQCCEACKKNNQCNAYVLFEGVCYLKSASSNNLSKTGATAVVVGTTTIAS